MAIAKMEKLALTFRGVHLEKIMQLLQGFQGVHIETGFDSTIPPGKKSKLDKDIREIEKNLQEIQAAYSVLKGRESSNMLTMLRSGGEKKLPIEELIKKVEESNWRAILDEVILTDRQMQDNHARREEIAGQLDELYIWEQLSCNPLDFAKLHRSKAIFGSVHEKHRASFQESLDGIEEGLFYERAGDKDERTYFMVVYHDSMQHQVYERVHDYSFSLEEYPFSEAPASFRERLEIELDLLFAQERELDRLIIEEAKYDEVLLFAEEYCLNALLRKKKSLEITYEADDISIDGWIISDRREILEKLMKDTFTADDYHLQVQVIDEKDDVKEIPIKLKNSRIVTVFERLTEMYSLPQYNEVDPTPIMTLFYLVFFGMMVADLGYGVSIFIVSVLVMKLFNLKRSTLSLVEFLYFLSFPIMGWGLVFGAFFGTALPFSLLNVTLDIIPMTIIAICLGYLHIMAGLVMQMINQHKLHHYFDLVTGGLAWFTIFLGVGMMIIARLTPWFTIDLLFWIGLGITGVGVVMTFVVPAIQSGKKWYMGLGKGLYALYGSTSYLGDFVSYSRLMALGVAGGSVALAFNTIIAFLPTGFRFTLGILLAIILHAMNIVLSMLSAYVHGIRLQFIEFFGKFYTGGGKPFEPFKAAEKNIIIIESNYQNK